LGTFLQPRENKKKKVKRRKTVNKSNNNCKKNKRLQARVAVADTVLHVVGTLASYFLCGCQSSDIVTELVTHFKISPKYKKCQVDKN
jgi:hypothetical protein